MKRWIAITAVLTGVGALGVAGILAWRFRTPVDSSPAGQVAAAIRASCRSANGDARQACYHQALEARIKAGGVADAMATLGALARADRSVERDGHVYAHGIGIAAYRLIRDIPATFGNCSVDFSSGCNHGVLQAYLESQVTVDSVAINALCQPYRRPGERLWQRFQCVHGTGHGLQMMLQGDLPAALAICDFLTEAWDRDACYGGAFMENIMHEIAPHHPATELAASHHGEHRHHSTFKALDPAQPLYPCTIVADRYLRSCYEIQTAAVLHFTKDDIGDAARICDQAPDAMQRICYQSLGRDISSQALRNPAKALKLCGKGGEKYRPACYVGVVKALVDWNASPDAGSAFCRLIGDRRGVVACFYAVGEQVYALTTTRADRERLCRGAGDERGERACLAGAGLASVPEEPVGSP